MNETKVRIEYKDRNGSGSSYINNLNNDATDDDLYFFGQGILRLMGFTSLVSFSISKVVDKYI